MKTKLCRLNGSIYLDVNGALIPFTIAELREFRESQLPARLWLMQQIPAESRLSKNSRNVLGQRWVGDLTPDESVEAGSMSLRRTTSTGFMRQSHTNWM